MMTLSKLYLLRKLGIYFSFGPIFAPKPHMGNIVHTDTKPPGHVLSIQNYRPEPPPPPLIQIKSIFDDWKWTLVIRICISNFTKSKLILSVSF